MVLELARIPWNSNKVHAGISKWNSKTIAAPLSRETELGTSPARGSSRCLSFRRNLSTVSSCCSGDPASGVQSFTPATGAAMYSNMGDQAGVSRPPLNPQPNPFGNTLSGAGSGLLRSGLEAYGERLFGSSSEFMQSNISRGHWTRISEPVGGRLSYKPPVYDINAPDLYIPFMAFGTYVILAGFSFGLMGKFSPEALSLQFTRGLVGWVLQFMLLKGLLYSLGSGEAPVLDIVAYGGYAFTGICIGVFARLCWSYSYYFVMPWMSLCMGVFLVKTMKRVLFTEMRSFEKHSSRQHYVLLFMAIAQFPLFFWLGNVGA